MHDVNDVKSAIDRMVEIKATVKTLEAEYDKLEAGFLIRFAEDTRDTKHKTACYVSESGSITAGEADSVKVTYPVMLKEIFGAVYPDMVTEEKTYKLTSEAKKILAAVYKKEYMRIGEGESLETEINKLPCDESAKKALVKKLKGRKFDSDKKNLMKLGGFSETEANDYAYMLYETANWLDFKNILSINKREDEQQTVDYINSAVTVETAPKITLKVTE